MNVFLDLNQVPDDFGPSAVTVGKFDGVHVGHRAVIDQLTGIADARGLASVAVTFDRNPLAVIRPDRCPEALVSLEQKLTLLAGTGVDTTLVLTFDEAMAAKPADDFIEEILVGALHTAVLLVGKDFRFGAGGAGNVELLRTAGAQHGFEVIVLEDVAGSEARRVSSSWLRELLTEGKVAQATALLGTEHTIRSTVVHGFERGRELGYPTANLDRAVEGFLPADGVYAAWLTVDGVRYAAAVSIGDNPTFGDVTGKQVEAHALDQSFDLYGKTVEVSFVDYVRGMVKFSGADALALQMRADEDRVRDILNTPRPTP